jgi:dTDP-4-amino-4,6-dideoxygalactose transaminase
MINIPFSPPHIDDAVKKEVLDTLNSGWITTGPKVLELEEKVSKLTNNMMTFCVNSWTSGAIMALKWFGIGPGDEVIIPAYTYCATALSVLQCGATPVMVDILDDFTIDPTKLRTAINSKTKAIIPVDIGGLPANYNEINNIINCTDIKAMFVPTSQNQKILGRIILISDSAHSIGAKYGDQPSSVMADIAIFSFHAVKNITTAEGGAVCLNLPQIYNYIEIFNYFKSFSLNGQSKAILSKSENSWKYDVLFPGMKINMPDICAAVGLGQIRQYDKLLRARKEIAFKYCASFASYPDFVMPPLVDNIRESSYHLFLLRIKRITEKQRDLIINDIAAKGISVNVHFIPLPMLTLFKNMGYSIEDFPNSYQQYSSEISLPIYPGLSDSNVHYIVNNIVDAVAKHKNHVQAFI